jgi:SlyX protein
VDFWRNPLRWQSNEEKEKKGKKVQTMMKPTDPSTDPLSNPPSSSNRIMELELQLMHLQNDFESLNEVVLAQHRQLDECQRNIDRLHRKLESGSGEPEDRNLEDEKPPHY